ncbi:MAG: transposase [Leptolyngbya sp. BL-A-14]
MGCQWEVLPHGLPPCRTVYNYFKKWQRPGIWQQMLDKVRAQLQTHLGR